MKVALHTMENDTETTENSENSEMNHPVLIPSFV